MKQALTLLGFSVRSIPSRPGPSLVLVIGTAGVVTILCFFFGMSEGLARALASTGREDRALVLRKDSEIEAASRLKPEVALAVAASAGSRTGDDGKVVASIELVRAIDLPITGSKERLSFPLRGVGTSYQIVRPELRLIEGRLFRPGTYELIVGRAVRERAQGLQIGDEIELRGRPWKIAGVFSSNGSALESEILTDTQTLQSLYQSPLASSMLVWLKSADSFEEFEQSLQAHPGLDIEVLREKTYFARQAGKSNDVLRMVALIVGSIVALGAVFAAVNATNAGVRSRLQEIAVLRAVGFNRAAVICAILFEAVLLSAIGAIVGAIVGWLTLNGSFFSTVAGGSDFSQTAFAVAITPAVLVGSGLLAISIGLIGGLTPAIRAGRLKVADALRTL